MPAEIRYSKISDFAKLVWAEIYCYNFGGITEISNKTICEKYGKTKITVSRAISELLANDLINITGSYNHRNIVVKTFKLLSTMTTSGNEEKTIYMPISEALQEFYKKLEGL